MLGYCLILKMMKMKIKIEYWDTLMRTKEYQKGGFYVDQTPEKVKEEIILGKTEDELFEIFYKRNNSLRYCNGSYWKFSNQSDAEKYHQWICKMPTQRSFELYYGNGVVD